MSKWQKNKKIDPKKQDEYLKNIKLLTKTFEDAIAKLEKVKEELKNASSR